MTSYVIIVTTLVVLVTTCDGVVIVTYNEFSHKQNILDFENGMCMR